MQHIQLYDPSLNWPCGKARVWNLKALIDGNKLKLNPVKTRFTIIAGKSTSHLYKIPCAIPKKSFIFFRESINLGVLFWPRKFMWQSCCQGFSCLLLSSQLLLSVNSCVETAILVGKVYDQWSTTVIPVQNVQNALCRIVYKLDRINHTTPYLEKLN